MILPVFDQPAQHVRLPGPAAGVVLDRVVRGGSLDQPGQGGRLRQGQARRDGAEVPAAGLGQAVVAVAEVGDIGVHPEDLGLAVGQVELDAQHDLLDLDAEPALAGGVEHLGQLLVQGCATLVAVAGDLGGSDPGDRVDVHPGLGVEAVILGRHQGLGEQRRHRRSRVGRVVRRVDGPGQRGGVAHGRGEREQHTERDHAEHEQRHHDAQEPAQHPPAAATAVGRPAGQVVILVRVLPVAAAIPVTRVRAVVGIVAVRVPGRGPVGQRHGLGVVVDPRYPAITRPTLPGRSPCHHPVLRLVEGRGGVTRGLPH